MKPKLILQQIATTVWNALYCTEIFQATDNLATELENEYTLMERRNRLQRRGN